MRFCHVVDAQDGAALPQLIEHLLLDIEYIELPTRRQTLRDFETVVARPWPVSNMRSPGVGSSNSRRDSRRRNGRGNSSHLR
jgi:hypothetical protein